MAVNLRDLPGMRAGTQRGRISSRRWSAGTLRDDSVSVPNALANQGDEADLASEPIAGRQIRLQAPAQSVRARAKPGPPRGLRGRRQDPDHLGSNIPIADWGREEHARAHTRREESCVRSGGQRAQRSERRPQGEEGGGGIPSERVPQWSPSRPHLARNAFKGARGPVWASGGYAPFPFPF